MFSIFIPQNRYDMCRRRKGGRCTKGTAGMVCYIDHASFSDIVYLLHCTLACTQRTDLTVALSSREEGTPFQSDEHLTRDNDRFVVEYPSCMMIQGRERDSQLSETLCDSPELAHIRAGIPLIWAINTRARRQSDFTRGVSRIARA